MVDSSLNASFWVMVLLQTIGSVDPVPGTGKRKMPAPRAYVTTIIAWGVLQIGADAGYEDGAAKFGWLMVLASMVLGPFGKQVVKLINWVVKNYGPSTLSTSTVVPTPTNVGPSNTAASSISTRRRLSA